MRPLFLLTMALCFLSALPARGDIPRMISYQGIVTDTAGTPIPDGTYTITFRLYVIPGGGTRIWEEQKTMQLRRGLISTTLGDQALFGSSVDFTQPYWLGIQIGADPEMQPRIRLTASGYSIRAEKSDTSMFAMAAPTPAVVDSSRIAGAVPDNSITGARILDGTIQRVDVDPSFKAPRADTADFALVGTVSGNAGGDLTGTYPNPAIASGAVSTQKLADNSITSVKIVDGVVGTSDMADGTVTSPKIADGTVATVDLANAAVTTPKIVDGAITAPKIPTGQVVKSLNGVRDNIMLTATGGATITSNGDTITITAGSGGGGTGVQGVQNTNNTLDVMNPSGPTVTVNVKSSGITTTQLADNAVTSGKISDGTVSTIDLALASVTNDRIADNAVTASKIADGSIVSADIADAAVTMPKINQSGAMVGQVMKWTGTAWAPASDSAGGPPSGSAGGDLSGTYPGPTIANNAITSAKIQDGSVGTSDITDNAVNSAKITDLSIGSADIATGAVTSAKILDGSVQRVDVASNFKAPLADTSDFARSATLAFPYSDSTSSAGAAFSATNTQTGGAAWGIYGQSNSIIGLGLYGIASATTGQNYGVWGGSNSPSGRGVYGIAPTYGVHGNAFATTGTNYGVYGQSSSLSGHGVYGNATATTGLNYGVYGQSSSNFGRGVYGNATATTGPTTGVYGLSNSTDGYGVFGSAPTYGVFGAGGLYGLYGLAIAGTGENYGVFGQTASASGYAGYFQGRLHVTGTLSKGGGSFKIDHPLDPANKYLYHSFVESPDMMNIYNGNVVLDANGEASVQLPEWFEALNRDFRYQLTCIGAFAPVFIGEEILANRFKIAGGKQGMKVSWQVTGIRKDAFAEKHRIPVEEEKQGEERGRYMHPEAFGLAKEMAIPSNQLPKGFTHPAERDDHRPVVGEK